MPLSLSADGLTSSIAAVQAGADSVAAATTTSIGTIGQSNVEPAATIDNLDSLAIAILSLRVAGKAFVVDVRAEIQLLFNPNQRQADLGFVVIFRFHSENHTVMQSSLEHPCESEGGFESATCRLSLEISDD
jgi:hypothetical protein